MGGRIVHLVYAGTSGATTTAINIARGSQQPQRHSYVLYGTVPMRDDYAADLVEMGCTWRYAAKHIGLDFRGYSTAAGMMAEMDAAAAVFHGCRTLPVQMAFRRRCGAAAIVAVHHGPAGDLDRMRGRFIWRQFALRADASVAVSAALAERISQHWWLHRATGRLRVIPNGLDLDFWRETPRRQRTSGPWRVGMLGTLDYTKDQAALLRAIAMLRRRGWDILCELIGDGPRRKALQAVSARLGIADQVLFAGQLDRLAVRERMGQWDVMAHASGGETFGMAVAEAMAARLPVVATNAPGLRELVEDGVTGALVPRGDDAAIAAAIEEMLGDREAAEQMGQAAAAVVAQKFSLAEMSRGYESLVDELTG